MFLILYVLTCVNAHYMAIVWAVKGNYYVKANHRLLREREILESEIYDSIISAGTLSVSSKRNSGGIYNRTPSRDEQDQT